MKLWEKGIPLDPVVEKFTVGDDLICDKELLPYDLKASAAHARALAEANILKEEELGKILEALAQIGKEVKAGTFRLEGAEDGHTAIENALTKKLGELGQKIHTGRSRNDQVLVALRLLVRERLEEVKEAALALEAEIEGFIHRFGSVEFPGYTHTRPAMPTDMRTWAGALRAALADDRALIVAVMEIIDQNPLGSGAGYGVPLDLNRELTTRELSFTHLQSNPLYTQHSRGKFDALVLHILIQVLYDLNRFCSDLIFFTLLGYLSLPDHLTTGSSLMPQKKNPDPLEIVRAYYHLVLGREMQALSLSSNLISGYHRDLQLLKRPLLNSFSIVKNCLRIMTIVFKELEADHKVCAAGITEEVRSTERVYELVRRGVPFRKAYRLVAKQLLEERKKRKGTSPNP